MGGKVSFAGLWTCSVACAQLGITLGRENLFECRQIMPIGAKAAFECVQSIVIMESAAQVEKWDSLTLNLSKRFPDHAGAMVLSSRHTYIKQVFGSIRCAYGQMHCLQ